MQEPIYEFQKGEGWLVRYGKTKYAIDVYGRKWLIQEIDGEPGLKDYWDASANFNGYDISSSNPIRWKGYKPGQYKLNRYEKFIIFIPQFEVDNG